MIRSTFVYKLALSGSVVACLPAHADFLKDSKASLDLRNFYMNRDFRQGSAPQSKAEEWAQGFLLRYESGFTQGSVGLGFDAIGLLGVTLDSSPGRSGTGLLQRDREPPRRAENEYGEVGVTAKVRISKSVLKLGTLTPKLPLLQANDSRLLPQTFEGGQLNSQELGGLTFDAGRLEKVNQRDSSDNEDISVSTVGVKNIRPRQPTSNHFDFANFSYKWNDRLTVGYGYGDLNDVYKQQVFTLNHLLPFGAKSALKSDIRFSRSTEVSSSGVDNNAFGAMFTYSLDSHAFGVGYQRMSGDSGFAYINGSDAFLINFVQINDFGNVSERSWQTRYDYNFASLGLPGLTFMTRYLTGDNIDLGAGRPEGKEWERDTDISYVIQSGMLKNLGFKLRNATVRSTNFGNDIDENRLIFTYSIPL